MNATALMPGMAADGRSGTTADELSRTLAGQCNSMGYLWMYQVAWLQRNEVALVSMNKGFVNGTLVQGLDATEPAHFVPASVLQSAVCNSQKQRTSINLSSKMSGFLTAGIDTLRVNCVLV